ncbi:MAG: hypothetical protein GY861_12795 [bacterium]|nr:hypothetical protein [bacterium]
MKFENAKIERTIDEILTENRKVMDLMVNYPDNGLDENEFMYAQGAMKALIWITDNDMPNSPSEEITPTDVSSGL